MDIYVIHAFDEIFGGLHGMEEWSMEECQSEKEAIEVAIEMSYDVIDSYGDITDILNERAEDLLSYDIEEGRINSEHQREQAFNSYYEDCVKEDVSYYVVKLNPSHSLEEYEKMLADGYTYDELIDEFGVEEY